MCVSNISSESIFHWFCALEFHFHLHTTCAPVYLLLLNSIGVFLVFVSFVYATTRSTPCLSLSLCFLSVVYFLPHSLYIHHIDPQNHVSWVIYISDDSWSAVKSHTNVEKGWKPVVNGIILGINLINWWTSNIYRTNCSFVQCETIETKWPIYASNAVSNFLDDARYLYRCI